MYNAYLNITNYVEKSVFIAIIFVEFHFETVSLNLEVLVVVIMTVLKSMKQLIYTRLYVIRLKIKGVDAFLKSI